MAIYPFRYWCHKILPLVYDDSLSYYELLCKVVGKLNECIEAINTAPDNVKQVITEIMQEWIDDGTLDDIIAPEVTEVVVGILTEWKNNGTIEDLIVEDLDSIVNEILDDWLEDGTIKNLLQHIHADNHYDIYVAVTTGNDDNEGTEESPIQSLEEAFKRMAQYGAGIYIHILEGGTYLLPYKTIHAGSVHITTKVQNVVVSWRGGDGTHKFYASYLHISGKEDANITFHNNSDGEAGFEPGKLFANHVTFTANEGTYFAIYGGSGQIRNSRLRCPFRFGGSNVIIDNCNFDPDVTKIASPYTRIIHGYNGSVITFVGTINFTAKANYGAMTSWIAVNRCLIFFEDSANFVVNGADSVIPLFGGECDSFVSTWAKIKNIINGNNTSLDNCVFNGTMARGQNVVAMPRIVSDSKAITVESNSTADWEVTFPEPFAGAPYVFTQISGTANSADIGSIGVQIVTESSTSTGCTIRVSNASSNDVTVRVRYLALHE